MDATCSCAAGKVGYCNHTLALMLKICKYSLFESKTTEDLRDELDENPTLACTSKLQSWHKKGRGDSIHPQPVMDLVVSKIKPDDEKSDKAVACQLYEARKITKHDILVEESFKKAIPLPQIHPVKWCRPNMETASLGLQTVISYLILRPTFLCILI